MQLQQEQEAQQTEQHTQHARPHEHLLQCARAVEEQLVLAGERAEDSHWLSFLTILGVAVVKV
jgi:hypothetical protein